MYPEPREKQRLRRAEELSAAARFKEEAVTHSTLKGTMLEWAQRK
jgi:hypothetical protein